MQVLIRKATVVDPRSDYHERVVDLLVEDGVIKNIAGTIKAPDADILITA